MAISTPDARARSEKYRDDLRLFLDAFERDVTARLPDFAGSVIKRAREEVQAPFESFLAKVEAIRTSGRYTADGEQAELRMAAEAMAERLAKLRADWVGKLDTQLAEKRVAALKPKAPIVGEAAIVRELRLRELRDHLKTLDSTILAGRVKEAIADGAGGELLDALEGAPVGFPLVPKEVLQEARVAIAERDHPELGQLAQLRDVYTRVLGVAERTLVASSDVGVADNSKPSDPRKPYLTSTGQPPEAKHG